MKEENHTNIQIRHWDKAYEEAYVRLNKEWIERYFCLEPSDLHLLGHPQEHIIDTGGEIFFALLDGEAVGCCALVCHPDTKRYELAKMAVSPAHQGKGIGYLLGQALMAYAREQGVDKLFLEANTRLEASIRLYHRLGFKAVEMPHPAYQRCNLYMEAELE